MSLTNLDMILGVILVLSLYRVIIQNVFEAIRQAVRPIVSESACTIRFWTRRRISESVLLYFDYFVYFGLCSLVVLKILRIQHNFLELFVLENHILVLVLGFLALILTLYQFLLDLINLLSEVFILSIYALILFLLLKVVLFAILEIDYKLLIDLVLSVKMHQLILHP